MNGCSVSDTAVMSPCPVQIWFPNAFTPDQDGLNDTFRPRGISIGNFRMIVFDRWGAQLFETHNIDDGWDGTFKGTMCQPETYSWRAWYSPLEDPGTTYQAKGTVILLR